MHILLPHKYTCIKLNKDAATFYYYLIPLCDETEEIFFPCTGAPLSFRDTNKMKTGAFLVYSTAEA